MATIKTYKNKERLQFKAPEPYVPQYLERGVEPFQVAASSVPPSILTKPAPDLNNPRLRQAGPFISIPNETSIPSVGNVQDTWFTLDTEEVKPEYEQEVIRDDVFEEGVVEFREEKHNYELPENVTDDEYLLYVNNILIDIGDFSNVEQQVNSLLFGTHELSGRFENGVSPKDIVVMKKVPLKVGVFLSKD